MNDVTALVDSINGQLDKIENHFKTVTASFQEQHYLGARQWNMTAVTSSSINDAVFEVRDIVNGMFANTLVYLATSKTDRST